MLDFIRQIFDTSQFPPRWECGTWTSGHGWLHILSDLGTWGAYTTMPLVIAYYVWRRKDVPFVPIFWLFGAFIFFCGSTHLMEAFIFWWPAYRLAAVLKLCTAVVSWLTVFAVIRMLPRALALPGLAKVNTDLDRAYRELDDFAYIVSHDLKAPLRGISSLAHWVAEDAQGLDAESRENLSLMMNRVQRMEKLINGILRYSRIGRQEVALRVIDSDALTREVLASLSIPPHITVSIEGQLPEIVYQDTMFHQIMQNLVSNSLKYNDKPEGWLTISCRDSRDFWEFRVSDNGPGIGQEHFERIFKIFQTLHTRDEDESTGMGLAIVRKIVENLGGKAWVTSEVGKGSTFHFTIPQDLEPQVSQF